MNPRFSEYATSGAFSISLTRSQVSSLSLIADAGGGGTLWGRDGALERKGLVEAVRAPTDHDPEGLEFRCTHAGLLATALCREAGLTNGPADPVAAELTALRAELVAARETVAQVRLAARATWARKDEAERERAAAEREIRRLRDDLDGRVSRTSMWDRVGPVVTLRDPLPDASDADLRATLEVGP